MPADWGKYGINYAELGVERTGFGAGGQTKYRLGEAILMFDDSGGATYGFQAIVGFAAPSADPLGLPSILGLDILSRMRLLYDRSKSFVGLQVLDFDVKIPRRDP
jgi:hypothetical protein